MVYVMVLYYVCVCVYMYCCLSVLLWAGKIVLKCKVTESNIFWHWWIWYHLSLCTPKRNKGNMYYCHSIDINININIILRRLKRWIFFSVLYASFASHFIYYSFAETSFNNINFQLFSIMVEYFLKKSFNSSQPTTTTNNNNQPT